VKAIVVDIAPLQITCVAGVATAVGVGLTVIVAVIGVPGQLLAVGVIVIVAVTGVLPLFVAVKDVISPVSEAARPIDVVLLVQLNVVPLTALLKVMAVVLALLQTDCVVGFATATGVGLTVIVTVVGVPEQPLATGVTIIVAVTGLELVLTAVNEPILPIPEAARPIVVLSLVQLNTVPDTAPLNVIAVVAALLQTDWLVGLATTVGVGLTVIVAVIGVPVQLLATGVMVIVVVTGVVPLFVAENAAISPVPEAARPIVVLLLVQLNTVPDTAPVRTIVAVEPPLQTACVAGVAMAFGVGLIVIVAVIGVPGQLLAVGVIVIVAVIGVEPVFTAVNDGILPLPLAANPMVGSLFVQAKVVPLTELVKAIAAVAVLLQTVCVAGVATASGVGLTVIVAVIGVPEQPPADGIIVIVAVTGVVPWLTAVKDGTLPLPEAVRPMPELLFVQVKVVPLTALVNTMAALEAPLQTDWVVGVATAFGVGLTVMMAVIGEP
jgi:hypothetical protein